MNHRQPINGNGLTSNPASLSSAGVLERKILNDTSFHKMISLERKRTERSGNSLVLMLLDTGEHFPMHKKNDILQKLLVSLGKSIRETDITGWHKNNQAIGVIFTDVSSTDKTTIMAAIRARASDVLTEQLTAEQVRHTNISFHSYPEDWAQGEDKRITNPTLYPDLLMHQKLKRSLYTAKRIMDASGSLMMLTLLSPLFLLIAVAIRMSSPGPVFFRQRRVGQNGRTFELLKFRSMHVNNNPAIHREYSTKVIAGVADKHRIDETEGVYKLTADPRVTRLGSWLRRSSLDELPQLFNVFIGEMSLVGPRPPLEYEVEVYELWHRARLLEAKPGITGLWQVSGRNRIKFDQMVRLDLNYARSWSLWLDCKILLRTPLAVLQGAH